jgi:hypothetical protein
VNIRLLADENFGRQVVDGLRRRVPTVDFLVAHGVIPPRTPDPKLLVLAANLGRVLVSHDKRTMSDHFYRLLETQDSPGLILISKDYPVGAAIYQLELAVTCSTAEEFRNRITWLPY